MAHQSRPSTIPARGNAANTGMSKTPAPVRKFVNPDLEQVRVVKPGYGTNQDNSPSSVDPGVTHTSALADELQRASAAGDGSDLQDVIEKGGRGPDDQTRSVSSNLQPLAHGQKRQTAPSKVGDVTVGSLPSKNGASAAPDPSTDEYGG